MIQETRLLLGAGASALTMDRTGATVLHTLLGGKRSHDDAAKLLMPESETPWIINRRNDRGETALEMAVFRLFFSLASVLLRHGADIRMLGHTGLPLLESQQAQEYPEVRAFLLENGARVDKEDRAQ
jgi:ankyrin repeat protein